MKESLYHLDLDLDLENNDDAGASTLKDAATLDVSESTDEVDVDEEDPEQKVVVHSPHYKDKEQDGTLRKPDNVEDKLALLEVKRQSDLERTSRRIPARETNEQSENWLPATVPVGSVPTLFLPHPRSSEDGDEEADAREIEHSSFGPRNSFYADASLLPEPLPPPLVQPQSQPGAFPQSTVHIPAAVPPQGRISLVQVSDTSNDLHPRATSAEIDTSGLVQANPVDLLPVADEAQPVDTEDDDVKRFRHSDKCAAFPSAYICLAAVLLLAVSGTTTALLRSSNVSNDTEVPNEGTHMAAPMVNQGLLNMNLPMELPNPTLITIESDKGGSTAQYQAYQWLQNDPGLPNYSSKRILQKFAMATLFLQTNGNNWTNSGGGTVTISHRNHSFPTQLIIYSTPNPSHPPRLEMFNITSEKWLSYANECSWFSSAKLDGLEMCDHNQTTLQTLSARNNKLTGQLPRELGLLSSLTRLDLWRNQLEGPIVPEIGLLRELTWLNLADNKFTGKTPSEIGLLTNLKFFTTIKNRLTGVLPSELYRLSQLEALKIGRNRHTGTLHKEIGQFLPRLKLLMFARNQFSGTLPTSLSLCSGLVFIEGSENQLTGRIPSELGELMELGKIRMSDNQLSGKVPSELGAIPRLVELKLENNIALTGTLPQELGRLNQTLDVLSLEGTSITGVIPEALCSINKISFYCSQSLCGCDCPCS